SALEYNGGAIVAMVGKNCVAIAADKRLGVQLMTISTDFQKIFPATDKSFIGLPGLATDVQTLSEVFRFKINMYKLREERDIEPRTLAHMVSSTLYEKRYRFDYKFINDYALQFSNPKSLSYRFSYFYAEPVVAGLDKNNAPFICSMDLIGCINFAKDFVVSGSSAQNLYGICESLWEPDL
ncbi:13858_t:CDS:2, partial [Acaulospora colombiana]